jgi:hypothetical protein
VGGPSPLRKGSVEALTAIGEDFRVGTIALALSDEDVHTFLNACWSSGSARSAASAGRLFPQ